MANSNTVSVDPRFVSFLVCNPEADPGRFAADTLNRCASALQLYGDLIGGHDGDGTLFQQEDHRFIFYAQLEGIAGTLRAVADALGERRGSGVEGAK